MMAGSRPSAVTVSSTGGTVARSGHFHPQLRGREGKSGRKRNFLEDASLVAALGRRHRHAGRPELPGIMVGMDVKDSFLCYAGYDAPRVMWTVWTRRTVLRVRSSSTPAVAHAGLVFPGFVSPRAVFPSVVVGPEMLASWSVWTRRTFMSGLGALVVIGWFCGFDTSPRCVPLFCRQVWIAVRFSYSAQFLARQWIHV